MKKAEKKAKQNVKNNMKNLEETAKVMTANVTIANVVIIVEIADKLPKSRTKSSTLFMWMTPILFL